MKKKKTPFDNGFVTPNGTGVVAPTRGRMRNDENGSGVFVLVVSFHFGALSQALSFEVLLLISAYISAYISARADLCRFPADSRFANRFLNVL